jgi:hypothetical protein
MCNCIAGNGHLGRRLRCTPPWRPRATSPALWSTPFYPAIAEPDRVRSGQLLVKMLQITIEILLPIALRHPLQHRRGHPLRQRLPSPPVKQPAKPALLVTVPPPHVPVRSLSAPENHVISSPLPATSLPVLSSPAPSRSSRLRFHAPHGLPILAARKADILCAISTGHIAC